MKTTLGSGGAVWSCLAQSLLLDPFWLCLGGSFEGGHYFFVKTKQMFNPFAFRGERGLAVKAVNCEVEGLVGFTQIGRHQVRVVKMGQSGVGPSSAGMKHSLGKG